MGCKVLLATINLEMLAFMPCNPSIGGSAKGIVVREIDALGAVSYTHLDVYKRQVSSPRELFSRGTELVDLGLDIPFSALLTQKLRNKGLIECEDLSLIHIWSSFGSRCCRCYF